MEKIFKCIIHTYAVFFRVLAGKKKGNKNKQFLYVLSPLGKRENIQEIFSTIILVVFTAHIVYLSRIRK